MMLRAMNEYDRNVQVALDEEDKQKKLDHQKKMKHPVCCFLPRVTHVTILVGRLLVLMPGHRNINFIKY